MKTLKTLGVLVMSGLLISCAKGYQTAGSGDGTNNGSNISDVSGAWAKVQEKTESQVEGGQYSNQLLIKIDKENQAIILILPLPPIFLASFTQFDVPDMPGVTVKPITNEDGGTSIAVSIPLRYVHKNTEFRDFLTLPNGDKLPFMPVGEMSGFAVSFPNQPKYRLHVYVAVSAAAVFVETPDMDKYWNDLTDHLPIIPQLGFPIKNKKYNQTVGYFSAILPKSSFSSGIYVASKLPNDIAQLINELIRF